MDEIYKALKHYMSPVMGRLNRLLAETPARTLQLTGILGLAFLLFSIARKRRRGGLHKSNLPSRTSGANDNRPSSSSLRQPGPSGMLSSAKESLQKDRSQPVQAKSSSQSSLTWAVQSKLGGAKTVTIASPGVLFEEWSMADVKGSVSLRADANNILKELVKCAAVYIVTLVEDDETEAKCRSALQAGGVVGNSKGQIPPQRILFCSTFEGKASIVRQLEPQLHIDSHPRTIEDLKRFMRLVHIFQPGSVPAGQGSSNVGNAQSLAQLFQ